MLNIVDHFIGSVQSLVAPTVSTAQLLSQSICHVVQQLKINFQPVCSPVKYS